MRIHLDRKLKISLVLVVVLIGIGISMFKNWEITGESWGYWFFARVLGEGGGFVVFGRSPLYTLYLNAFRWIGYPNSVTIEYVVTTLITVMALVLLFKRYFGLWLAVFAALLWIPYLQVMEPPVQKLALAFSCLAVVVRLEGKISFRYSLFYALLVIAWMFRPTYVILIIVFVGWDLVMGIRQRKNNAYRKFLSPRHAWPIMIVAVLSFWFVSSQSDHPWNNVYSGTTKWFPVSGKNLGKASFFQKYNMAYIRLEYGSYEGKDWYFTNQELFGDAENVIEAVKYNPAFVFKFIQYNIRKIVMSALGYMTSLKYIFKSIFALLLIIELFIFIGALNASNNPLVKVFLIGNLFVLGSIAIFEIKSRYFFPLIPILSLSAGWYGYKFRKLFYLFSHRKLKPLGHFIVPLLLILFTNGLVGWSSILSDLKDKIMSGRVSVLESSNSSMKSIFSEIVPLIKDCDGVLTGENNFLGAFSDIPIEKIYDVFEIPPFGSLKDSDYNGLNPNRVDCLLISNSLSTGIGNATNWQIRYDNYIEPYVDQLLDAGAFIYDIPHYGRAIVLSQPQQKSN